MDNLQLVKNILLTAFNDAIVDVGDMTGTNDHLEIVIASDDFQGKTLLQQHQMVMTALKTSLAGPVHAVKLRTMTKAKYQQNN